MKAFGAYWALFCFISSPANGRSIVGIVLFILARKGVFERKGSAKKAEKTEELVTVTVEEPVSDEETVIEEITEIETVEEPETEEQNREVKTEGNTEDHDENN